MGHEDGSRDPAAVPVAWVLSARTSDGLRSRAARLSRQARADTTTAVTEIGARLVAGGTAFGERAVVVDDTREGLLAGLDALAEGRDAPQLLTGAGGTGRRVVFVFPGQGTEWPGMASELLRTAPVFAASVRACERALAPYVDWSLEEVLTGADGAPPLDRVDVVQPALFATMVSLAALWRSFGVVPDAVVGHSQGEIAAAYVAGALSLDDAARLVALRSRALHAIRSKGGMVTVLAPDAQVRAMLAGREGRLWVAAVNGPAALTVSGDLDALSEFEAELSAARMLRWRLPGVDFAAHSGHVEAIRDEVLRLSESVRPHDPESVRPHDSESVHPHDPESVRPHDSESVRPRGTGIAFYSSVTAGRVEASALGGDYWYRNLREPVRFQETAEALIGDGHDIFVECGPQPVLTVGLQEIAERARARAEFLAGLRRDEGGMRRFVGALGEAYVHGLPVDWRLLHPDAGQGTTVRDGYAVSAPGS
ncbi:hypothetical protein SGFS_005630 [Streptomyces graminofaciens]|uniref:Malonyl-CoA:ACP transacylase (MAT) domain-containing protein n=1 Tax=Streptomyces graminofaciens TaxID=68212 RepID=A0ABM8HKH8_9ACTN|nr:acyltransferase domain-containing protein [Streptomyces graminofaciens]BBC29269.1 hypothetical protein SGFS_005630 [Streptomyces graminofaciens]